MFIDTLSENERKTVVNAVCDNMKPMETVFPTRLNEADYEALKRSEVEHAPNVAVRIVNFRVQYYNTITGEVVSEHC